MNWNTEFVMLMADRWLHGRETVFKRDQQHRVVQIVGNAQDVTERKQVENRLRHNQKLIQETQELSKLGGWFYDVKTKEYEWTEEVYHIHELPLTFNPNHDAESDHFFSFYAPEDRPLLQSAFINWLENGEPYNLELPFTTAKQNPRWVRTTGKLIRENGVPLRVAGLIMDITQQKLAEQCLRESEERFRELTENIDQIFYINDVVEPRTLYISSAFEMIFGRPCACVYENISVWLDAVDPRDRPALLQQFDQRLLGKPGYLEYRIVRLDGTIW